MFSLLSNTRRCTFRWVPRFFGLTSSDKGYFLRSNLFTDVLHGFHLSRGIPKLPVWQRTWFIDRLNKELQGASQSRATHDNDPETRALTGKHNPHAPARLRRFT